MTAGGKHWVDVLHYQLADFLQGGSNHKVIVLPRGFLKSTIVTRRLSEWLALRDPSERILIVMNSATNAMAKLREVKRTFERDEKIRSLFPELLPTPACKWSDTCAELSHPGVSHAAGEGTWEAAGVGTKVTSKHYTTIIEDDTGSPDLSDYDTDAVLPPTLDTIVNAIHWHGQATPLQVDPESCRRIVVGTRWTYYDLINYVKENEKWYEFFDKAATSDGTLSGRPTYGRFQIPALKRIAASMSEYLFHSLYMNSPLPAESMAFHLQQIQYTDSKPMKGFGAITVDTAKWKTEGNQTALVAAWHNEGHVIVLDSIIGYFQPSEVLNYIFSLCERLKMRRVLVESDANQYMYHKFIQDGVKKHRKSISVEEIYTKGDSKDYRVQALQPLFNNGQISFFRTGGNSQLISQVLQYPYGRHKDGVDALAYHGILYQGLPVAKKEITYDKDYKFDIKGKDVLDQIDEWRSPARWGCFEPSGLSEY